MKLFQRSPSLRAVARSLESGEAHAWPMTIGAVQLVLMTRTDFEHMLHKAGYEVTNQLPKAHSAQEHTNGPAAHPG